MSKLLSDRIKDLHLRPNAPYPSEVRDGHDMVLQLRRFSKLRLVADNSSHADSDGDNPLDDGEMTWPL